MKNRRLLYVGEKLPQELVDEARTVLGHHIIRKGDEHELYRSLWYVIANQRINFEPPLRFSWALASASLDQITDLEYLRNLASSEQIGLMHTDRFESALEYCTTYPGGITKLGQDFLADPFAVRRELVRNVTWIAHKSASLWYLSLGGTELMTLDVHNYRQLAGLGVNVDPVYFKGARRRDRHGRIVIESPSPKEYERIEKDAKKKLSREELLWTDDSINCALTTTMFWIVGAKATRGMNPVQYDMFTTPKLQFLSPYEVPAKILPLRPRKKEADPDAIAISLFAEAA